ncbi:MULTISPECIES: polyphosphate--glucose phosphotransferase [unclassified Corynebacterium]|uniref:polyphosphate--glucose phosphotransferase n=1 Tax=unclassified Corynebacterium TaxID=2624378 RepID=UPI0029CA26F7|nr:MULTISPECIES: ROK family protein [unclassified Corynebacterium]WPF65231.1 ROK family protein [Corynebacterium sp. 22KM0430]WPF67726.1 ROK family protein [Corynebacterium sp. 21KM1197]
MSSIGFGIDVGGSGVKGARVNLDSGEFASERIKILTPQPATPEAVAKVAAKIVEQAEWTGPVGVTVPGIVRNQVVESAANIDSSWVGTNAQELFSRHLGGRAVTVLNDADAAGLAEVTYGIPEAATGPVIFLTLGTGIGSAILIDGHLYPNSELGHLEVDGKEAEHRASSAVKERKDLSYKQWAKRVDKVLHAYEALFSPSLFIVGGGISRKSEKWIPLLTCRTEVVPARLLNTAGIVGAAMAVERVSTP